jgi:hypothetical protein
MPPVQIALTQSLGPPHGCPFAQRTQLADGPPQSTPVSLPFFTPSAQFATRQKPPVQTPLEHCAPAVHVGWQMPPEQPPTTQSVERKHVPPVAQPGQLPPPQSMPVSAPFLTPSVQVGA